MILPLIYYGNPILRKRAEPVEEITDEIRQLAQDMIETMNHYNGVGIAAPQVGRSLRLFIACSYIETSDGQWKLSAPTVYINPVLSMHSEETIEDVEGCLSIPKIRENVVRPLKVTIEATDPNGKLFKEELEGYNARIRMHENDHINGVLFIDRIAPDAKQRIEPLLRQIKKEYN